MNKKINIKYLLFFLFQFIFFISLITWLLSNNNVNKNTAKIKSDYFIEYSYLNFRNKFWRSSLREINKQNNLTIRKILLRLYVKLIPVKQWWHPLYLYKTQAYERLAKIFISQNRWRELEKIAINYILQDERNAQFYYFLGLASEKQNHLENSIKYYRKSLEIESTHANTIKRLSKIYINKGDYINAQNILEPYLKAHGQINNNNRYKLKQLITNFHYTGQEYEAENALKVYNESLIIDNEIYEIVNKINAKTKF